MEKAKKTGQAIRIAIVLLPEYSQMVHMLLSELLRIAGLAGSVQFETIACSKDGQPVCASNGRMALIDAALQDVTDPHAVIVCASYNPYDHIDQTVIARLRQVERHGALIGGIDTGTITLAEAGLLNGRRATLHWDELELAREKYPNVQFTGALVECATRCLTGCGSLGTIDFALALVSTFAGQEFADGVMDLTVHGRHESKLEHANSALARAVKVMSGNIEAPLSIAAIAEIAGLSTRQLTRIFDRAFGIGPGRYYQDLRLERAREMVVKTRFPLSEIALSTGFSSASWFSRAFKEKYGISPNAARYALSRE